MERETICITPINSYKSTQSTLLWSTFRTFEMCRSLPWNGRELFMGISSWTCSLHNAWSISHQLRVSIRFQRLWIKRRRFRVWRIFASASRSCCCMFVSRHEGLWSGLFDRPFDGCQHCVVVRCSEWLASHPQHCFNQLALSNDTRLAIFCWTNAATSAFWFVHLATAIEWSDDMRYQSHSTHHQWAPDTRYGCRFKDQTTLSHRTWHSRYRHSCRRCHSSPFQNRPKCITYNRWRRS